MFFAWLLILIVYGLFHSFSEIHTLMWSLLVPFYFQDDWDTTKKHKWF